MRYNELKIFDASGKIIKGEIKKLNNHKAEICVNDRDAKYPLTIDPLSSTADWTAIGENNSDEFGVSVATAGDVNGDGYGDVIVAARGYSSFKGKAYLYLGSSTGLSTTADWSTTGQFNFDNFGISVSTAGDVNGDGYSDVIIGAQGYSSFTGRAYLFSGSSSGLLTSASWAVIGENSNDYFGSLVSTAGDVNGDGYSDVIVGANRYSSNTGKAYIYYGSSGGLSILADWTAIGENSNDRFGGSACTAGDVNGDGYSDVIIGAFGYSTTSGKTYLYLGGSSGLSTTASWTKTGENNLDRFGYSFSTAGDINGDGYSDVIIGAYGNNSNSGKTYLYLGSSSGLLTTAAWTASGENTGDFFGYKLSTAGDINGDGYSEVIVGAYSYSSSAGKTYLFYGGAGGLSTTADWTAVGENSGDNFGISLSIAGDVNGDGYSDIIVGANGYSSSTGKGYLYYGNSGGLSTSTGWTATGEDILNEFGISVNTAGDVNGDGYSDVIVGAYRFSSFTGKAYLYYGSSSGLSTTADWTATGENIMDYFGLSIATAGDLNGDGYNDVIVGAYKFSSFVGKAYLYYGSSSGLSTTADWTATGENNGEEFGFDVSTGGDINGDGYCDLIVSSPGYSSFTGKAYLYYGSSSGLSTTADWTATGENTDDTFGNSIAAAGDVNGDGFSDVIVGAYGFSSFTGKAYLYFGSSSGFSSTADWTVTGENNSDYFGACVSTAGDINGDGYSDIIIGAEFYSSSNGKAYLYFGSSSGPSAIADWDATGENNNDQFGIRLSTAGDVNSDGYSDVLVSANGYSSFTGKAYLYYGSAVGLSTSADWTATGENSSDNFGVSVSSAGDVNGDGYSDIIVGADFYSDYTGKAYLYYGNSGSGLQNNVQQYQPSSITIIGPNGSTNTDGNVRLSGYAKSPFGRAKGKLVYEYKETGIPFSGQYSTQSIGSQSSFTDLGAAGIQLNADVSSIPPFKAYNWRVRTEYSLAGNPYQKLSPWRYYISYQPLSFGSFKSQTEPLPVELAIFTVKINGSKVELNWETASEVNNYGFEIERKSLSQPSQREGVKPTFDKIGFVNGSGNSNSIKSYLYIDENPVHGKSEYRLKQIDNNGDFKYSNIVEVSINKPEEFALYQNYPNPFNPTTKIEYDLPSSANVKLEVYNSIGQLVAMLLNETKEAGYYSVEFNGGKLSSGIYFYKLQAGNFSEVKKFVLMK